MTLQPRDPPTQFCFELQEKLKSHRRRTYQESPQPTTTSDWRSGTGRASGSETHESKVNAPQLAALYSGKRYCVRTPATGLLLIYSGAGWEKSHLKQGPVRYYVK
ncbi:hypothetical protein MRX96_044233 [Rhipicephalus microplus]